MGEIVVEWPESVQEEEIVRMVEGYGRRKISLNCAWLLVSERDSECVRDREYVYISRERHSEEVLV